MDRFFEGGGVSLSPADLVRAVKFGDARALAESLLVFRMAVARARDEGLDVADDELEQAIEDWRSEQELFEDEDVAAWLAERRLAGEDLAAHVRERLLVEKLRRHLVPDDRVEDRYRRSLHDLAVARAERIVLPSAGAAAEVLIAVREGEQAWDAACALAGGVTPLELRRRDAGDELSTQLFGARPMGLVGPVEEEEGHAIYRLLGTALTELDDELREEIRSELFDEILRRPLARQPFRFTE